MPIPTNAKKVFKGIIFDVYQWEQKQFNGTTKTFEMLKRENSVQVLPVLGDKIIIAEEEQPNLSKRYGLIGGQANPGEEMLAAAQREMKEEIGYTSEDWVVFRERNLYNKIEWTIACFVAKNCTKTTEPDLDPGERITPILVTFDEFMDVIMSGDFRSKDLTLDILKLHYQGKLDEFKKMLFR
jgi:ADP-ribose pyrophosphatase